MTETQRHPESSYDLVLARLKELFPGRAAITRSEFRESMGLSKSVDARMKREGHYPALFGPPRIGAGEGTGHCERILITDMAAWLLSMRGRSYEPPAGAKKRGRPAGSRNKPKTQA